MSSISFEIRLKRENKIYYEGELLQGCVRFNCPSETKHDGITLTMEGMVNLQLSSKNVGLFDAFYNSVKPITLLNTTLELSEPGKLSVGPSEFHFELPLVCKKEPRILYETYHGIFVNINYQLRCDVKRNFLAKSLQKTQQFCIHYKPTITDAKEVAKSEVYFNISPETLQKTTKERISIPRFLISGKLDHTECCVTEPFTGQLTVQHTIAAIKSIEMQLVRVETCGCAEGYSKDATEIQTIQIADGNICPKLEIPIYIVLPRLFTCPTLITKNFKVGKKCCVDFYLRYIPSRVIPKVREILRFSLPPLCNKHMLTSVEHSDFIWQKFVMECESREVIRFLNEMSETFRNLSPIERSVWRVVHGCQKRLQVV